MRLYSRVTFKVFAADCKSFEREVFRAPKGAFYTESVMETLAEEMRSELQASHPGIEFKFVRVGPNSFNVIHHLGHA